MKAIVLSIMLGLAPSFTPALAPDAAIDQIEEAIARRLGPLDIEGNTTHRFTPGLYIREFFMPEGTLLTSRIHRYEHPFVISKGVISVWSENEGPVRYAAPHTGITLPRTRRVLLAHEDTIWTTFHLNPDDERDPEVLVARLTFPHDNLLLEKTL